MNPLVNLPFKYMPIRYNFTKGTDGKKFIIVHDTQNFSNGADALAHYKYFNSRYVGASADYFVDDKRIIQVVGDSNTSWAIGDNQGYGRALNGAKNRNSISVEICVNKDGNYAQAVANAIELVKNLMKKFRIPESAVQRHYDVSRKKCAGTMISNNWKKWKQFKEDIKNPIIIEMDLSKDSTGKLIGNIKDKPVIPNAKPSKPKPSKPKPTSNKISVDGYWGAETTKALQKAMGTYVDGIISGQYPNDITKAISSVSFKTRTGSNLIKALQKKIKVKSDGYIGPDTVRAIQLYLNTYVDGIISKPSTMVKQMQKRLNEGKF